MLKNKFYLILLGLIIFLNVFILSKLIFFPYPELFVYPYLANHNLKPYAQILDQHFPGLMFFPINLNNLGMTNPDIARIWLFGIVVLTHLLLFFISANFLKSHKKALLVNLLYLFWHPFFAGWVLWIDNFLPLFLLPAFYSAQRRKMFLTGLFLSLAIMFKQTIIPLAGLVFLYVIFTRKASKEVVSYLLGLCFPLFLMILYVLQIGVFIDFWYWNFTFNLITYAKHGTRTPVEFGFISRIIFVYLFSIIGIFYRKKETLLLYIFLFGSLILIIDRADFVHLQPSLPFAVLATVLGMGFIKSKKLLLMIMIIFLSVGAWWQVIFYKGHLSNKVFFFDEETYKLANKIKQNTKAGDRIFLYGVSGSLYQMTNTLPAGDIFVFQFPWFLKVAEVRILDGIIKDQPKIIVFDRSYIVEGEDLKAFSGKIYQYIETHYQKTDNIGSIEILQRRN